MMNAKERLPEIRVSRLRRKEQLRLHTGVRRALGKRTSVYSSGVSRSIRWPDKPSDPITGSERAPVR